MRFLLLLFCISPGFVFAQMAGDTVAINEITVEATRILKPSLDQPVYITRIDSARIALQKGLDLGTLLGQYTSLYIRDNGPGAASVISQRGFGGSQVRVLWEGMPINHLMLGVTDLSLLPVQAFSGVEVTSGTGSSMYGSGISGTVYLKSDAEVNKIYAGQSVGSYGNYITSGGGGMKVGNFNLSLKASAQNNENDFRYYDPSSNKIEKRERGAFENDLILGSIGWRKENTAVKSSMWWSRADHEIAENIYAGTGASSQYDESLRWLNSIKIFKEKTIWEGKFYLAKTALDFFNPPVNLKSLSESRELTGDISTTWFASQKMELSASASISLSEIETNNFNQNKNRNQFSTGINASLKPWPTFILYPALRVDYYSDFGTALSPSLGINYKLIENKLAVRGMVARNFRAPTFNDLFWPQGGNESLSPEFGIKSEVGLAYEKKGRLSFNQQLNVFYIYLDEGIKWLPDNSGQFQAQNIEDIVSRGIEWFGEFNMQLGNLNLDTNHNLSYTRSFIAKQRFRGDEVAGNQLPYVPKIKYAGSVSVAFRGFSGALNGVFVDDRYTTEQAGSSTIAEHYLVFDFSLNYTRQIKQTEISVFGRLNNVFNERYDVVRFYPMPLRNYLINITLTQNFK